jgi:SAM-dependent methyltransferase
MSFDFHHDKPRYFNQQYLNSKEFIIPFISKHLSVSTGMRVLEIGCAEGGVLKAFTEIGCICTGVELSSSKVENANKFMANEVQKGLIKFICKDIYQIDFKAEFQNQFDLIILKDTIEHIHDQQKLIRYLKEFLTPSGQIYFGFPPWYMPWGGHQQICKSKILMYLPYFHLLPMPLYKLVLKTFGETESKIGELTEIKETGVSTSRFEIILRNTGYKIVDKQFYLVNPIYLYKFGWKPRKQIKPLDKIPVANDLLSTTVYYLIKPN